MNIKALALAAVTAISTATIAPAPAEAFWGPSNKDVCETNYSYVKTLRNETFANFGLSAPIWKGDVVAADKNAAAPALGYKYVTGCVTQYTHEGATYIQGYNVEKSGKQYFVSLAAHIQLN